MGNNSSKTKLVLIELIIIILFFSIAGGVCVNIFAQARVLSMRSTELTNATLAAQTAAELIRGAEDEQAVLEQSYQKKEGGFTAFFDDGWAAVQDVNAKYRMDIDMEESGGLLTAYISVNRSEDEIYSVTVKKYLGK